jgi:hypothetical protein
MRFLLETSLDLALTPLDALRRAWLRVWGPYAKSLFRSRAKRVAWFGALSVALAFVFAVLLPLPMLAIGPLVLGVPHLLSDVRYLLVRQGLHRDLRFLALGLAPLALVWVPGGYKYVGAAWVGGALASRSTGLKKVVVLSATLSLAWLYGYLGAPAMLFLAYAHNYIAAGLLLVVFTRSRIHASAIVLMLLAGSALIVFGGVDALVLRSHRPIAGLLSSSADLETAMSQYALGMPAVIAMRLLVLFVFAQSVHYIVWLRALPDELREREGIRSFRASVRALRHEMSARVLFGFALLFAAIVVWGIFAPEAARLGYLQVASFHAHLELAFLAWWLCQSAAPVQAKPAD